ncbi:MAG: hypothetical protein LBQ66_10635 [Planctomycetaceae bacterium]|jgi:ABC-type lipoprotein release transport system permease subunit|nr:hypothetical protein [Planctomycetaceae bacterium]
MNNYPFSQTFGDVFASLRQRKGMTFTVIFIIALFVAALFLVSQFCTAVIRNAEEKMPLPRIILTQGSESIDKGFTKQLLEKIKALREVKTAVEYYEVTTHIRKKGDKLSRITIMESADKDDIIFQNETIFTGSPLQDEQQVVLGQILANKLGIDKPGMKIVISMERTTLESSELHEDVLSVVGFVKGEDRAYVLPAVAKSYDLWAAHTTREFGEERLGGKWAAGTRRAKLYLHDYDDVEKIAKQFAPAGYLVDHQLEKIKDLENLKRKMVLLVALFLSTSFVLCFTSLIVCSYFIHCIRRNEFKIMLQRGIPRKSLKRCVMLEGTICSFVSIVFAALFVFVSIVPFQKTMSDVFGISYEIVTIDLHSQNGILPVLVAAVVAMIFGMLTQASALPLWFAKRL